MVSSILSTPSVIFIEKFDNKKNIHVIIYSKVLHINHFSNPDTHENLVVRRMSATIFINEKTNWFWKIKIEGMISYINLVFQNMYTTLLKFSTFLLILTTLHAKSQLLHIGINLGFSILPFWILTRWLQGWGIKHGSFDYRMTTLPQPPQLDKLCACLVSLDSVTH